MPFQRDSQQGAEAPSAVSAQSYAIVEATGFSTSTATLSICSEGTWTSNDGLPGDNQRRYHLRAGYTIKGEGWIVYEYLDS